MMSSLRTVTSCPNHGLTVTGTVTVSPLLKVLQVVLSVSRQPGTAGGSTDTVTVSSGEYSAQAARPGRPTGPLPAIKQVANLSHGPRLDSDTCVH
jgi:hypothetical protein